MTQYEAIATTYDPFLASAHKERAVTKGTNASAARQIAWSRPAMIVNTTLLLVLLLVCALYVYFANITTAGRYSNKLLQSRAAAVAESNGVLEAQNTTSGDTMSLLEFAQRQAMIPASDATHIFEDNGVALGR